MNQEKTGKFLAEIRKQRGMTQKELAEQIGISDKTISKWECGNSIPDITYFESLCNSLDITVNELLSGERLSEQSYSKKAEENIMALMKENKTQQKSNKVQIFLGVLLAVCAFSLMLVSIGMQRIIYFFDIPSILLLCLFSFAGILLSGKRTKGEILDFVQKTILPIGGLIFLFELVLVLSIFTESGFASIGPHLAVCILVPLYAVLLYLILTCIKERK